VLRLRKKALRALTKHQRRARSSSPQDSNPPLPPLMPRNAGRLQLEALGPGSPERRVALPKLGGLQAAGGQVALPKLESLQAGADKALASHDPWAARGAPQLPERAAANPLVPSRAKAAARTRLERLEPVDLLD